MKAVKKLSIANHMNATHRNSMEDAHVCIDEFGEDPTASYFGVYDGHGGERTCISRAESMCVQVTQPSPFPCQSPFLPFNYDATHA